MMRNVLKKALIVSVLVAPMTVQVARADDDVLIERIERLERIVKGQGLVSLLGRVDQLQNEVQRLNGDNETLRHQLETMKRRQREMYIDLDGRLQSNMTAIAPTQAPGKTALQSVTNTRYKTTSTKCASTVALSSIVHDGQLPQPKPSASAWAHNLFTSARRT